MARSPWLAVACLLLVDPAYAEEETGLALRWQAPPDCPDEQAVLEQVRSLLAAPAGQEAPLRSIRADGLIVARDGRFELELELRDGALLDRRQFTGETCQEVAGAAAVAIALLMRQNEGASGAEPNGTAADPTLEATGASAATKGSAQAPASPAPGTTAKGDEEGTPVTASASSERALHALLLAPSVGAGFGLLPQATLALGAGLGVEPGRWRFTLSGTFHPDAGLPVAEVAGTTAEMSRQTVTAVGCRWLLQGPVELAPCLSLSLQILTARAAGEQVSGTQVGTAWLALGPTALARLPLGKIFALTANVGVEVETARPRLVIEGLGTVAQVGPLEIQLGMGLEWIY